jgi:hypothetical protein
MTSESTQNICETRILIGFLGEKHQSSWWDSSFLSSASKAFLTPIYPNSVAVAQYSGVCRAASIVHDEHIGIGKHYHLYRLPDSIERSLLKCMQDHEFSEKLAPSLLSKEAAIDRLKELGKKTIQKQEGPIVVGDYLDEKLVDLIKISRSHYLDAIQGDYKTFPYMRYQ